MHFISAFDNPKKSPGLMFRTYIKPSDSHTPLSKIFSTI